MAQAIPFIMNGNGTISVMLDGTMKPIDTAHKNYDAIKDALKEKNWEVIPNLVNIVKEVEAAIDASTTASGRVSIKDGEVYYGATVISNTLADRIVSMAKEGFDVGHMVAFLENLIENPSYRAVNELYDFLEAGAIPITENGTFLTYKKIRNDWTDIHSGTFDNSVGATCEMPRNMVNEDSSQTCSAGLHVCSYDYLPNFSSANDDRVVICEVNPADVVSIPADYGNTKMRCCKYVVIGEVEDYKKHNILATESVVYTRDVQSGATPGTVNHAPNNKVEMSHKEVGKAVSGMLSTGEITDDELFEAMVENGIDRMTASEIQDIAEEGDYVRVGKKVAKLVANESLDKDGFMAMLDTDEEDPVTCERCGTDLNGDSECPECGYWN